ncbi:phytoene desaturase family protein [Oxyplasma meridianum]|uniref:Phytoene desaturase family protein n=1 Tax=Oxyplasma meridianum TaxID=3073602 RepID=A0AAX4NFT4_9ARCH
MDVVIVGAGFGGLASAALLANLGYSVTVLEKNNEVGGRSRVFRDKGYTFDMGPSWYLMPEVFENYFKKLGKNIDDYYQLKLLDPSFRIYYSETAINVSKTGEKRKRIFDNLENDGYEKFQNYLKVTGEIYAKTMGELLYKQYKGFFSMLSPFLLKMAINTQFFQSMSKFNSKFFDSEELRALTGFSSVFLGGTPESIPAVYSMVNYSIFQQGVFYPEGGFGKMVDGIMKLCLEVGVKFKTGFEVKRSETDRKRMTKVFSDDKEISGDIFLFNSDYVNADSKVIGDSYSNYGKKYWERANIAPSAILAYCGIKGDIPLEHHNIFIGKSAKSHYDSLEASETIPEDFSFYASLRSKSDSEISPSGNSNLFILIPVSQNFNDSPQIRERYVISALNRISHVTGLNIAGSIDFMRIYGKGDFINDYNAFKGTAFGLSQTIRQTAGFRPLMRNRYLENVFYAGQYTHPGIGVPMVFIAAEIVSSMIQKSFPLK